MIFNSKYIIKSGVLLLGIFCVSQVAVAQEDEQDLGTEVVNVVKPYTPTISDAFKVKATPVLNDSVNTSKKKVTYGIFSVPVASTFTPAKGKAANVKKAKKIKLYDNYATLGFGSLTSILAEFYSNIQISRTENFGVFLNHNSSQGGIDGIQADDYFYDTRLNLNYGVRERDLAWRTDLDLKQQVFNWYGVDPIFLNGAELGASTLDFNSYDPSHSFLTAAVNGSLSLKDAAIFKEGKATLRYFGDSEENNELRFIAKPTLEFPVSDENITTNITLDYLSNTFDAVNTGANEFKNSHLNIGIAPSLVILRDDLTVNLGVAGFVNIDSENSQTDFFVYPKINASYRVAGEYFIAYAGLEGDLQQNSYYDFTQENPFVTPAQLVKPTDRQYDGFVGMKGKLSNTASYNLRAGYMAENNKALFRLQNFVSPSSLETLERSASAYGNSFQVRYDNVNTFSVFGELNFDVSTNFKMRLNGQYNAYTTDVEIEAWNLPELTASVFGDYQITDAWFAGINLFFVGERKDQRGVIDPLGIFEETTITLDSYFDANAHIGYRISDRLSAFGRVNNILGTNYEKWLNYPVQGIQALVGATYKFDF
ncbi:MAG: hypothetical protein ACI81G_000860 [Gammaproteobacteria bacterium]|jgi:hypothetical protein